MNWYPSADGSSLRRMPWIIAFTILLNVAAGTVGAATLLFRTDAGVLSVEVDDPSVNVLLDGEELKITGAGPAEIRLKIGPHLFPPGAGTRNSPLVLTVSKDGRVVIGVSATAEGAAPRPDRRPSEILAKVNQIAGELVSMRTDLDQRVWPVVSSQWTTTEAAKLLIAFFRGEGDLPGWNGSPEDAARLRADLGQLRQARQRAFRLLSDLARQETDSPTSPLCGTWEIVEVLGAGGVAADALELYEPDPVGRKFVAANETAGLLTGAGFWLFEAEYGADGPNSIDLSAVVRGGTVYRGVYRVDGDRATLRVSPMNSPRPSGPEAKPTDGGFLLRMRRTSPN